MFRFARISAAAACLALQAGSALAQDVTADTVVAEVNGQKITVGHMIALRGNLPEQYQALPDDVLFQGILDQLIQQSVLSDLMDAPSRVEQLQIENQDRAMAAGLVIERILAIAVTDAALQAAYDARFSGAEPETEYNAAHILVATEDEAKAIVAELAAGGDFAAIAKERSQDPGSGAAGGGLGWFGLGMMVPEFETAVVALEPGTVSPPVQSQFGWHIIMVTETRIKAAPPLDEMREELLAEIRDSAVQQAIADATAKAQITRENTEGIDPAVLRNVDLLKN